MLALVGGGKKVLDLGCAEGDLARALTARGCRVSGVDVDAGAAERARPDLEQCVVADLQTLDLRATFPDTLFDVLVYGDVLEHLMDPLALLRQSKDVLAPGGYVVISIPNVAHASVRLSLLAGHFEYRPLGLLDATHVRFFTRDTLYRLLADAGLAPADVRRTTAGPFATEMQVPEDAYPADLVARVLEDPDAQTYQFVLSAVPDDADAQVAKLRQATDELAAEANDLRARLEALRTERQAELAAAAEKLTQVQATLDERDAALAAQAESRRTLDSRLSAAGRRLRDQDALLARRAREAEGLHGDLAGERQRREQAEEHLAAVLGSTAWRVAAPVRALGPLRAALQGPARTRQSLRGTGALKRVVSRVRTHGVLDTQRAVRDALGTAHAQDAYLDWVAENDSLSDADRVAVRKHCAALPSSPLLSVVMPVYDTDDDALRACLDSVLAQLYPTWELCVVDDASPSPSVWRTLVDYAARDPRVRPLRREENGGIVASTNDALAAAEGEFVVLVDHDDVLPEHALYFVALEVLAHPDVDLIYSDEDKLDVRGLRYGPYFKPDFNLELLLGQNVISHLGVYRTSLVRELGGMRAGFDGSQDHDLALRVVSASSPERIRHIPRVLYHWRQFSGSGTFSSSNPDKAASASRRAVADFLVRTGEQGDVVPSPIFRTWNRVVWQLPNPAPSVTVIIPTRDHVDLLRGCLSGLLHGTDYPDYDVIVVDNGSVEEETHEYFDQILKDPRVSVLHDDGPFNYSALNNRAAQAARGDLILLLNNDIMVTEPLWLREMASQLARPGVGAVGAKLLYEDGLVQHAGVVLGMLGVANHAHKFLNGKEPGHGGRLGLAQQMSAVTGACLLTRRRLFHEVGGLDQDLLPVAYNDIDYCLKLRDRGWRTVWTPHAELLHLESRSRGTDIEGSASERLLDETEVFRERWGHLLDQDPAYNPNLSIETTDFGLADRPRLDRPWQAYSGADPSDSNG
ncbi:MAG: glycosyltransferase [Actinobacteria bacterium]|nr:glycosyltransferase [Actinomycetota bacterium]